MTLRVIRNPALAPDRLLLVFGQPGVVHALGTRRSLRLAEAAQVGVHVVLELVGVGERIEAERQQMMSLAGATVGTRRATRGGRWSAPRS